MKSWVKIILLNLVFSLVFLLGFLIEPKDPMQIISHMEFAFFTVPIPFSAFYGFYSYKLTKSILWPNLIFCPLMMCFSLWLDCNSDIGVTLMLGVFFCFVSCISSAITSSLNEKRL